MIRLSIFRDRFDNKPYNIEVTLKQMVTYLLTSIDGKEKDVLPLWSPAVYPDGDNVRRSKAHVMSVSCLTYDVDDGMTPFQAWQCFSEYTVLAHTSWSTHPAHNRYRIILPLKKSIPKADWPRAAQAALELWNQKVGRGSPDIKALKDCSRMYYRYARPERHCGEPQHPMCPTDWHESDWWFGDTLDLDYSHIPEKKTPVRKARPPITFDSPQKAAHYLLATSMSARLAAAEQMGAALTDDKEFARKITCPGCGRPSVYFAVEPTNQTWARCNHQNSCGWWGHVHQLL